MKFKTQIELKLDDYDILKFEDDLEFNFDLNFDDTMLVSVIINILHYKPFEKGSLLGLPEDCYTDEHEEIDFVCEFEDSYFNKYIDQIDNNNKLKNKVLKLYKEYKNINKF